MPTDISDIQAAQTVKVVGSAADGTEQTPVGSSVNGEVLASDTANSPTGGADKLIALTTTPVEGKVAASVKADRKYIIMEGLTTNIKWGFSASSQSFDLFKSQLVIFPAGPNTKIWFKVTAGTGSVGFGEA